MAEDDKVNRLLVSFPESYAHIVRIVDALPAKDKSIEYVKLKLL